MKLLHRRREKTARRVENLLDVSGSRVHVALARLETCGLATGRWEDPNGRPTRRRLYRAVDGEDARS